MNSKSILVIQFRTDQSGPHEQECFHEEYEGFSVDLHFKSAIFDDLDPDQLRNYDGLILGGSGEHYLTKGAGQDDWLDDTYSLLGEALDNDMHTLGVCFGSQILALHQGGKLSNEEKYHESGSYKICLEENAEDCEIFSKFDSSFHATLAHRDTPIKLPDHFVPLASSELVPYQAFRIVDKPAWGTLFHPELNRERLNYRLRLYPAYVENEHLLNEVMDGFKDTSLSSKVLHHFYEEIPVD